LFVCALTYIERVLEDAAAMLADPLLEYPRSNDAKATKSVTPCLQNAENPKQKLLDKSKPTKTAAPLSQAAYRKSHLGLVRQ